MSDEKCTQDKTPGIISWSELATRDTEASKNFYTEMFGWTTEEMEMPNGTYTTFNADGRPVGGMMALPAEAEKAPVMWLNYITVPDVKAAVEKASGLGCHICKEADLPMGSYAVVVDPQGAAFGLWQFAAE